MSTVKQDLDRQIGALEQAGISQERIYVGKKAGATTDRPGLREVFALRVGRVHGAVARLIEGETGARLRDLPINVGSLAA